MRDQLGILKVHKDGNLLIPRHLGMACRLYPDLPTPLLQALPQSLPHAPKVSFRETIRSNVQHLKSSVEPQEDAVIGSDHTP
jgi:hypothetical protein